MDSTQHSLVVGGTGMLRGVPIYLATRGDIVSVVARDPYRLNSLVADAAALSGEVQPLSLDYRESDRLRNALQERQQLLGPVRLAVCWVHSTAPHAMDALLESIESRGKRTQIVHLIGSGTKDPLALAVEEASKRRGDFLYQQVVLGYASRPPHSSWLTNEAIVSGVISAIESGEALTVVGTVHPWSNRPGIRAT